MAKTKKLPDPREVARVREILEGVIVERFGNNETATARALGVTQATVNYVRNKKREPGPELIDALSKITDRATDDIRGLRPRFRELPGWEEALPEAMRMFKQLPPAAFEAAGNLMGMAPPGEITPLVIGQIAQGWYASADDATRIAARRSRTEAALDVEMRASDNDNELFRGRT